MDREVHATAGQEAGATVSEGAGATVSEGAGATVSCLVKQSLVSYFCLHPTSA